MVGEDQEVGEEVRKIDEDARVAKSRELAVTTIHGKRQTGEYDVFFSYNGDDREAVLEVAWALKGLGLRPWVDVWDLIPGEPWQEALEEAIERIKTAAIFLGPNGLGPWERLEMQGFLQQFVERDARVMPILLPGLRDKPKLPAFLRAFSWVDLRELTTSNLQPLTYLVAGITGRRPDDLLSREGFSGTLLASVAADRSAADARPSHPRQVTLLLDHHKLKEIDREAVRAQLADQLGVTSSSVRLVGTTEGSVRLTVEIDHWDDLVRLFALVPDSKSDLYEQFKKWKGDPKQFLEDNADVLKAVQKDKPAPQSVHIESATFSGGLSMGGDDRSVRAGGDIKDAAVATGDDNVQKVQHEEKTLPDPGSVDIVRELARLRELLEGLELDGKPSEAVKRSLNYAEEEANAEDGDRSVVAGAVGRAIKVANESGKLVKSVEALTTAGSAIAGWCGEHAPAVVAALKALVG